MKKNLLPLNGSALWRSIIPPSSGKLLAAGALMAACGCLSVQAATITWDFEDGTMQGWTNKMVSTTPALAFTNVTSFWSWDGSSMGEPALQSYFLAQTAELGNGQEHQTIWVQSPSFYLDNSGPITFRGMGSTGADVAITNIPAMASAEGTLGVVLRRDDGVNVLTKHVTGGGSTFDVYTIPASELASFIDDGHSYTLNVVDYYTGAGDDPISCIAIDNVNVPGVQEGMSRFDFEDGMQGWTNTRVSTNGMIGATAIVELSFGPITEINGATGHFLGEVPAANAGGSPEALAYHQTIVVESPAFTLNGKGNLSFRMTGASGDCVSTYQLPNPLNNLAGRWNGTTDTCAVGLRRDDGNFVLTKMATNYDFTTYYFTKAQLQPFVNDGHKYTVAAVDTLSGTWAWMAIDDVVIPGDIDKLAQTITGFTGLTNRTFGVSDIMAELPNVTASSGLPVKFTVTQGPATISGSILNVTNFGTVTVKAEQLGNGLYAAATPVSLSFTVIEGKGSQIIYFDKLTNQPFGKTFTLAATTSSGLSVTYTLTGAATISGDVVTCNNGDGVVKITAHQNGSANYNPAPDVSRVFLVTISEILPINFWGFNDGTMDGWTNKWVSRASEGHIDLQFAPLTNYHGFPHKGPNGEDPDASGAYIMGQFPIENDSVAVTWGSWPNAGSGVHHTLWVQSPPFYFSQQPEWGYWFNNAGTLGAINPATGFRDVTLQGKNVSEIPEIAGNLGAESGNATGYEGSVQMAIIREDGLIVWAKGVHPAENYTQYWITQIKENEVTPWLNDGHIYTLNVIDFLAGPENWISFDNMNLPGTVRTGPEMLVYDWNDGTMQGWVNRKSSTAAAGYYDLAFGPARTEQERITAPAGGAYFLGQIPESNDWIGVTWANWPAAGSGIHQTLWAESPAFYLTSSNAITFMAAGNPGPVNPEGGTNNWNNIPLTTIPDVAGTWGGNEVPAGSEGVLAIGLRRDDGTFVLTRHVNNNNGWNAMTFAAAQIGAFVNDGHSYTLNVVDALGGGYAWIALDEVRIPGKLAPPSTAGTLKVALSTDKTKLVLTLTPTVAGQTCTLVSSDTVTKALSAWTSERTVTTVAGTTTIEIPLPATKTFYKIKQ